jgi:phage baseplate assembly protein W
MTVVEQDIIKSVLQNIQVILTTPKGSDVHRPDFGSELYKFIDQPLTALTAGKIKAYIVEEIERWEPRVKVMGISLDRRLDRTKIELLLAIENVEGLVSQSIWI